MTNFDLSLEVFAILNQAGTTTVVVCAGARNAPMVLALQSVNTFKIYNFFEERSAAFFALGLIKATGRPVAVLTTSGTAVAELLPATIEARYQGLPLILVTADRPKTYRGTGSPQTIDQVGLFAENVESVYDLDVNSQDFKLRWSLKKPLHLNVSYDEPLIDKGNKQAQTAQLQVTAKVQTTADHAPDFKRPMIILGEVSAEHHNRVAEFITKCNSPVYAESLSQLRRLSLDAELVRKIFKLGWCDSVIRIGGVPTLRFWRDLESEFSEIPVCNYTDQPWTGLSRKSQILPITSLSRELPFSCDKLDEISRLQKHLDDQKQRLIEKYPLSEQSFTKGISENIKNAPLYIGNSLPIRNWDQFAITNSCRINANRGANGIDGQISTYLGWSENETQSFCFVGDLTAMYDLASLGLSPQLHKNQRSIIIMNNFGGQIFNRVFKNGDFINAHDTQFFHWAKMWNWDHVKIDNPENLKLLQSDLSNFTVFELLPDAEQTASFWSEWDLLCLQP